MPDLQRYQSIVLSVIADCAPFQVSTPHADPCFLSCDRSREAFVRCARGYQAGKDRQGSLSCFDNNHMGSEYYLLLCKEPAAAGRSPVPAGWPSESKKSCRAR